MPAEGEFELRKLASVRKPRERKTRRGEPYLQRIRGHRGTEIWAVDGELSLPAGFPERYRAAILRAVDQCAVQRHLIQPPELITTVRAIAAGAVPEALPRNADAEASGG